MGAASAAASVLSKAIVAIADAASDREAIKFVTYTRTNAASGQVYSGRASGTGSPEEIVANRARTHPPRLASFGAPVVDRWAIGLAGYDAIRGREQQLIDANGRAQSDNGTSANKIRGVGRFNPLAGMFDIASTAAFGPISRP